MSLLTFKYDLGKDTENFVKGLSSVNSKVPTKLQEEFSATYGADTSTEAVRKFLEEKGRDLDFEQKATEIVNRWEPIEAAYISRCEELFGTPIPIGVIGYITLNQKCTYNWRENYFFIYYGSQNPNKTIMHELLHFYTHRKYDSLGIESKKFNDIKEALTVLLNIDFANLMAGSVDDGYSQHQEMRREIVRMRKEGLSVDEIVHSIAEI